MLPKKRHRRSASVPAGTPSESFVHRRHHRSGILQPVPIHSNAATRVARPLVTTSLSLGSSDTGDVSQSVSCQPTFYFCGSNLQHVGGKFAELGLPFGSSRGPKPIIHQSSGPVASSCSSSLSRVPVVRDEQPGGAGQSTTRCHSQPGASLKRRRDEYRPWLDIRKMRETAYALDCGGCTRSRSSMLLSTNEEELHESPVSRSDDQTHLAGKMDEVSLSSETRCSKELIGLPSSVSIHSPLSEPQVIAAEVLVDVMPETCISSSSEDEEVAAINANCEEQEPLTFKFVTNINSSSSSSSDNHADDLDLESIERN